MALEAALRGPRAGTNCQSAATAVTPSRGVEDETRIVPDAFSLFQVLRAPRRRLQACTPAQPTVHREELCSHWAGFWRLIVGAGADDGVVRVLSEMQIEQVNRQGLHRIRIAIRRSCGKCRSIGEFFQASGLWEALEYCFPGAFAKGPVAFPLIILEELIDG
jgi:hypothetical protein